MATPAYENPRPRRPRPFMHWLPERGGRRAQFGSVGFQVRGDGLFPNGVAVGVHVEAVGDVDIGLGMAVGGEHEGEDVDEIDVVPAAIIFREEVEALDLFDLPGADGWARWRCRRGGRAAGRRGVPA